MKIIVTPGRLGLVSDAGQIVGTVLPEGAVLADLPESGADLPLAKAALLRDGKIVIVPNFVGSGPWFDQSAPAPVDGRQTVRMVKYSELAGATVDRLTAIDIDEFDFDPDAAGWKMLPRPETAAEKKAREKAEVDAAAAVEAERRANRKVSAVQIRLAANELGVRNAIETVVADPETPQEVKDYWEYSTEYHRASPVWAVAAPLISATDEMIDRLFDVAETK
ncbi:MAG TPA: hypothetical protein PLE50_00145 [Rhabdaerophilum sp.]|nr:hypothetical protein [Rhabdaerophilum sp.]